MAFEHYRMSPDKSHLENQLKPTRWMRRIVVGLVLAVVVWLGVRELVAPRPLAQDQDGC